MLASSSVCSTTAGGASTRTPSCSKTSALPQRLDTERLPCFATLTPARGHDQRRRRRDVEGAGPVAAGAAGVEDRARRRDSRTACARIVRAKPTISAGRSPFMRSTASSAASDGRRRAPLHDLAHDPGRLVLGEVLVAHDLLDQRR